MSLKIISVAGIDDFYVDVKYKKTNRHKTKIFTVTAKPAESSVFTEVGTFYVLEGNQIKYVSKPSILKLLTIKIQRTYDLDSLLELLPN